MQERQNKGIKMGDHERSKSRTSNFIEILLYQDSSVSVLLHIFSNSVGRNSSVGIATTLRAGRSEDLIPVGARFFTPVQTDPGAHPASCTMGTGSFPGVKRPGRGVDHPPHSSAEVKERVELYFYFPFGPSWPVIG
jgi:hypothetical protein